MKGRNLPGLALLAVMLAGNLALARPHYNWDLLPYLGVSYRMLGVAEDSLHGRTFAEARSRLDSATLALLTEGNAYRVAVSSQPRAFLEQLPWAGVKPAYPALTATMMRLGVAPLSAQVWISRASYVFIGLAVYLFLLGAFSPVVAGGLAGAFCALPFSLDVARLSTPDALSAAVVLLALYADMVGRRGVGWTLLTGALLIRPDNLPWVLAIALHSAVWRKTDRRVLIAWVGAAAVLLWAVVTLAHGYGWPTFFHHHFVERLPYPAESEASLSAIDVLRTYLRVSHPVNLQTSVLPFSLLGCGLLWSAMSDAAIAGREGRLLFAGVGYTVLHWLLLPGEQRLYVAPFLLFAVMGAWFVRNRGWVGASIDPETETPATRS